MNISQVDPDPDTWLPFLHARPFNRTKPGAQVHFLPAEPGQNPTFSVGGQSTGHCWLLAWLRPQGRALCDPLLQDSGASSALHRAVRPPDP